MIGSDALSARPKLSVFIWKLIMRMGERGGGGGGGGGGAFKFHFSLGVLMSLISYVPDLCSNLFFLTDFVELSQHFLFLKWQSTRPLFFTFTQFRPRVSSGS